MSKNGDNPSSDSEGEYCYVCEDGGATITCTICSKSYCYSILGDALEDVDDSACVSVPRDMVDEAGRAFPCPDCLEIVQAQAAPYIINRAARATQRRAPPAAVVFVIFHIESLKNLAFSVRSQVEAALNAFQINVVSYCGRLDGGISDEDQKELINGLDPDLRHHVVIVFITESHPGGGWWWESGTEACGPSQVDEVGVLKHMNDSTRILARAALSVRYFGLLCGWSLDGDGVVSSIAKYLTSLDYLRMPMRPHGHLSWVLLKEVKEHKREALFAYKSLCCGFELQLAVFLNRLRSVVRDELPFTEEDWDPETCSFGFDPATMIRMTVHPATPSAQGLNNLQGNPRTLAGEKTAAEVAKRRAERTRNPKQPIPPASAQGVSSGSK
ncbi:ATPase [Ceratobasidium sp. AG-Ba]|nr:ATPase [Ceratobasidium sp. AG-Ba]